MPLGCFWASTARLKNRVIIAFVMKADIHPKYYADAPVTCACGNSFSTGSTLPEIKVDICSACHPFFTGKMKFIDTLGRVEKFQARMKAAQAKKQTQTVKKAKEFEAKDRPTTLKEMIERQRGKRS